MFASEVYEEYIQLKKEADDAARQASQQSHAGVEEAIYTNRMAWQSDAKAEADAAQEHFERQHATLTQEMLLRKREYEQQLEEMKQAHKASLQQREGQITARVEEQVNAEVAQREEQITAEVKEQVKAEVAESVSRDVQSRLREYARAAEAAQEAAVAAAVEKTRAVSTPSNPEQLLVMF